MLYDPKWEVETKAEPYTLPHLIAWLETKNPRAHYDYNDCSGACLLDQYISSITGEPSHPSPLHYAVCGDLWGYARIAGSHPRTFGAALERARGMASQPLARG